MDEIDFNISFIKLVKQYPVLYDHSIEGSTNRSSQEYAWQEIGNKLGENWVTCKEKWKNIRSCYTRHLRHKANDTAKRSYYLSQHLEFILPFCKSSLPFASSSQAALWTKIDTTDTEVLPNDPLDFENSETEQHLHNGDSVYVNEHHEDTAKDSGDEDDIKVEKVKEIIQSRGLRRWRSRKRKLIYPIENTDHKILKKPNLSNDDDSDLNFLKSLLPDLRAMTCKQKNKLKITILNEVHGILYPDE